MSGVLGLEVDAYFVDICFVLYFILMFKFDSFVLYFILLFKLDSFVLYFILMFKFDSFVHCFWLAGLTGI